MVGRYAKEPVKILGNADVRHLEFLLRNCSSRYSVERIGLNLLIFSVVADNVPPLLEDAQKVWFDYYVFRNSLPVESRVRYVYLV